MENIKRDGVMEDAMEKVKEYGREQYQNGWDAGCLQGMRNNEKVIEALESSMNALDYSIDLYENVITQLKEVVNTMKECNRDRYNEGFQAGLDEAKMNCQEEMEALRHELINERHKNIWLSTHKSGVINHEDGTEEPYIYIDNALNVDKISLSEDDDE